MHCTHMHALDGGDKCHVGKKNKEKSIRRRLEEVIPLSKVMRKTSLRRRHLCKNTVEVKE